MVVQNLETTKPRGYAFIEYEHERDMHCKYFNVKKQQTSIRRRAKQKIMCSQQARPFEIHSSHRNTFCVMEEEVFNQIFLAKKNQSICISLINRFE